MLLNNAERGMSVSPHSHMTEILARGVIGVVKQSLTDSSLMPRVATVRLTLNSSTPSTCFFTILHYFQLFVHKPSIFISIFT